MTYKIKMIAMLAILVVTLSGCAELTSTKTLPRAVRKFEIPTIAVLDFENKVQFRYRWNLGQGVRDLLVDELVKSRRYTVLTRGELDAVVTELEIQGSPHFRNQGKAARGQLKNVQYLIKGSVTDFSHVAGGGLRAFCSKVGLGGSGEVATVSVTLYVIEVETGEILASESLNGRAYAGEVEFEGFYSHVSFGGKAFYRTPLGKATKEAISKCLKSITETIGRNMWYPRVVKVDEKSLVISGGIDRGLRKGSLWAAYEQGEALIDPATGDVLGREKSQLIGIISITNVKDKYSIAEIISGQFKVGQKFKPYRSQGR